MIMIKRFLFYRVQREAGGLTVYEAIENAIDILPYAARALGACGYLAFIRAQVAADSFVIEPFVVEGFVHKVGWIGCGDGLWVVSRVVRVGLGFYSLSSSLPTHNSQHTLILICNYYFKNVLSSFMN